ncbi:MAG: hypothetical protein IPG50_37985 [Myxococcales bacterium]|nr:hypothetical protein [Myxococcales bacterium]
MNILRLARAVAFSTLTVTLLACSSDSTPSNSTGTGTGTPSATNGVAFRGTLTGKGESGTIDATLPSGTKVASLHPLAGEPGATNTVVATLTLGGGKTVSVTGTYDEATKTLSITGNGYTLTGTLTGSTLSGTYTGPNGPGSFALQAAVSGAVNVYCGSYVSTPAGKGGGTWNLVQGADNKLSGSYTEATGGSGLLSGTLSGSAIALTVSTGGVANGTLSGDKIDGTYGATAADKGGTWTGSKGDCAK